ncbi:Fe-S oxidoreductase [Microbacterium sp. YY-03]|uniref:Fe-S oxidoreductase n=1 Tax=Microbacterium sp. YY-03 TaxID=3421636 RepID=UPI003D16A5A4
MTDPHEPHWKHDADQALIKGRRIDHLIPPFLLDSPISRVGYWWGTAVGMTWGFIWSRGKITESEGLWVFRGLPSWAFPRGGVCVGRCFLTGPRVPSAAVLKHERVHMRQWRRYGFLMPLLYTIAGRNALTNRFEIEAGLEDGNYVPRHHRA